MKERFVARSDIPQSGWLLLDAFDNGTAEFACQNCHYPHVRFVHELRHRKTQKAIRVGCVCAEHLTKDFATPRLRERALRSWAGRRMRWPTLNWKMSHKGNLFLKKQGMVIVVKRSGPKWVASFRHADEERGQWTQVKGYYDAPEEAKLAAFDALHSPSRTQAS